MSADEQLLQGPTLLLGLLQRPFGRGLSDIDGCSRDHSLRRSQVIVGPSSVGRAICVSSAWPASKGQDHDSVSHKFQSWEKLFFEI